MRTTHKEKHLTAGNFKATCPIGYYPTVYLLRVDPLTSIKQSPAAPFITYHIAHWRKSQTVEPQPSLTYYSRYPFNAGEWSSGSKRTAKGLFYGADWVNYVLYGLPAARNGADRSGELNGWSCAGR